MPRRRHLLAGATAALLAGCAGDAESSPAPPDAAPPASDATARGYTHQRPTGNRLVAGRGSLPGTDPVDVAVSGTPTWIVGVPAADASAWAVVTEAGDVTGVHLDGRSVDRFRLDPDSLPRGAPPMLSGGDPPRVAKAPAADASTLTHPVPVAGGRVYLAEGGDLVLWSGSEVDRVAVDAPRDARIVTADGRAYVLADATDRYEHAVIGDGVEGGSVAVIDATDGLAVEGRVVPPGAGVVEGLSPLLADVTGDGTRDILVTVSGDGGGARLAAYRPDGTRVATGPTLGAGWRHQLAVAPFGPGAIPEIAAVRMPHVAHELQFVRRTDDELRVVASATGYRSHVIGSRNLDAALAGDLDGDGTPEVLLPTTGRDTLAAVRRTDDGAEEVWTVPVGGDLSTNVGAVDAAGGVTVAAGHEGGVRFWPG